RRRIRPEVARLIWRRAAHQVEPRPGPRRIEPQREELRVVPQLDVVLRLLLLDQAVLEDGGFLLGPHDDGFEIAHLPDQPWKKNALVAVARLKIAPDPRAQALGFSDVQHLAIGTFE